ncbi:class F sortase [Calidifontibacter terrae]
MPTDNGHRRGRAILSAAVAVMAAVGLVFVFVGLRGQTHPPSPSSGAARSAAALGPTADPSAPPSGSASSGSASASTAPAQATVGPTLARSLPTAIGIPSIRLATSALVQYGLAPDGAIDIPASKPGMPAGWFNGSPTPGQPGPSVIVGHVDSKSGPSVFFHLGQLRPGQTVDVTLASGKIGTFSIDSVEEFHKAEFPTLRVYGHTDRAGLRLITCGGPFNSKVGHYEDNIVVFAHLTSSRSKGA